jgi:3-oxoacyl-[acyl-carrier-protein] synthase III
VTGTRARETDHWLALASPDANGSQGCRIESVGVKLPARRLTTKDLMSRTRHHTRIQLERLTGIHERHVVGPGENSYTLATGAARDCLAHSLHQASDIEMLINAGVYREDNIGEPTLAALIQEDIGANPGQPPAVGHGTFSFDLMNGTCGVISAIQVEAGFLQSGVIRLGAIVTSDASPEPRAPRSVSFRPAGGAMLLAWDDGIAGFTDFGAETFPEYEDLFVSGLVWHDRPGPHPPWGGPGQSQMVIDEKPGYQARLADCAEEATRRFLRRVGMGIGEIDLLVAAPSAPAFVDPLRASLGVPGDRVAYVAEDLEGVYTTGPIAALQAAVRSGRLGEARNTLMLAAGAGLTVVHALYRQ